MTPIELKKLRNTKKEPQSYFAFMPPFRVEGNAVLDYNGYFVRRYSNIYVERQGLQHRRSDCRRR